MLAHHEAVTLASRSKLLVEEYAVVSENWRMSLEAQRHSQKSWKESHNRSSGFSLRHISG
jgi:hypothetical protein